LQPSKGTALTFLPNSLDFACLPSEVTSAAVRQFARFFKEFHDESRWSEQRQQEEREVEEC